MERTRNKKALKDAKKEFKKGKLPLEADRILMAESDYGEEHPLGLAIKRGITKNKPYQQYSELLQALGNKRCIGRSQQ